MAVHPGGRLEQHLRTWLGEWPPTTTVDVVGSSRREQPGWDGRVFALIGVRTQCEGVLSVPPPEAAVVRERVSSAIAAGSSWDELTSMLPNLIHRPDRIVYSGIFRWCEEPADMPDAGEWLDAARDDIPDWLHPFGHQVLVARDPQTGRYLGGVGLKRHDEVGRELAVGTEPAARGQGLARRLVAQAARRVLDEGGIPTYQHDPANAASARVAEAAGFPDRGWRSIGMP
jgi:RimJ/RimL family protein N-acetyltransferase